MIQFRLIPNAPEIEGNDDEPDEENDVSAEDEVLDEIGVDEGLVHEEQTNENWTETSFARCYNPNKPEKWHFKCFALNDSLTGYMINVYLHEGSAEIRSSNVLS